MISQLPLSVPRPTKVLPRVHESARTLLLWAVTARRKPLSSRLVDHCETYKNFLIEPAPELVDPHAPHGSHRWRPSADGQFNGRSQCYVVPALRATLGWIMEHRGALSRWESVDCRELSAGHHGRVQAASDHAGPDLRARHTSSGPIHLNGGLPPH